MSHVFECHTYFNLNFFLNICFIKLISLKNGHILVRVGSHTLGLNDLEGDKQNGANFGKV